MPHSRERFITSILLNKLKFSPVLAIQGARQTGKSFIAREILPTNLPQYAYVTFDKPTVRQVAGAAIESFLETYSDSSPLIIDEAQKVPDVFDAIKYVVDRERRPGKFILLGSTEFSKKFLIRESLTGRMSTAHVYPLTAAEALQLPFKAGSSSLSVQTKPRCERKDVMRHLQRGGMPGIFSIHSDRERELKFKEWIEFTAYRDLAQIPKVKLDGELAIAILRLIATLDEPTAGQIAKTLKKDVRRIQSHLNGLEMLFAIHKLNPIVSSSGKPYYFLCDVGFANYFEASLERLLHTWLIQEVLAHAEWSDNIKETIGLFRSPKGALTHLVVQHSRTSWTAVKIIPTETFSEKDIYSLRHLPRKFPDPIKISTIALTPIKTRFGDVDCIPWEAIV